MDSEKTLNTNENQKEKGSVGAWILRIVLALAVVLVLFWFGFTFRLKDGYSAIVLRFGAPRTETGEAGLHLRLPWPFESVVTYDGRLNYSESNFLETTTKDKRNVLIQSYSVWQISDPLLYHNSVGASGKIESCIQDQIFSATNSVMGSYELSNLVSLENETLKTEEIQATIQKQVAEKCLQNYGITVKSVKILQLSLPNTNLQSVFDRMAADRQKDIDTIIANAERDAAKIRSEADAEAAAIIADGITSAAAIAAEAEKEVAAIYAAAQEANLELYTFLRELDTVAASVGDGTVLVVSSDTYPFNILKGYASMLEDDSDAGNKTVTKDLEYIMSQLSDEDRKQLTDAIYALIEQASKKAE